MGVVLAFTQTQTRLKTSECSPHPSVGDSVHSGKSNAAAAHPQWAAWSSKHHWKRKPKCGDGRLCNADAHTGSRAQSGSTAFSSAPEHLCAPGGGCTLQDRCCVHGCGLKGYVGRTYGMSCLLLPDHRSHPVSS